MGVNITEENLTYIDCLDKILSSNYYKVFLFFDEIDTKIIKQYYIKEEEKITQQEIVKK